MTTEKPPRYKRATIQVAMAGEDGPYPIEVKADVLGDWAIHRFVAGKPWTDQNGDHHSGLGTEFTVTHAPTGLHMYTFDAKREARYFAERISGIGLPKLGNKLGSDVSKRWSKAKKQQYRNAVDALANEAKSSK